MFALQASDWMVVVTSMVLVFLMLIILCLLIDLQGKIFDALNAKKQPAPPKVPDAAGQPQAAAPAAQGELSPEIVAVLTAAVRAAQEDIPPEIVAVIAAAVYQTMGEGAVIRGIRRVSAPAAGSRRGKWGDAGVYETTTPFQ